MVNDELKVMWKETVVAYLEVLFWHFLEGLIKAVTL
jgi:hypothetical protein